MSQKEMITEGYQENLLVEESKTIPYEMLANTFAIGIDQHHKRFSNEFYNSLELILVITRSISLSSDFVVVLSLDLARDLIDPRAKDIARSLERELNHASVLAHKLTLVDVQYAEHALLHAIGFGPRPYGDVAGIARILEQDINRNLNLLNNILNLLDFDLVIALQNAHDLDLSHTRTRAIELASTLGQYIDHEANIISIRLTTNNNVLEGGPTPDYFGSTITPYLKAVAQIQQVIDRLTGEEGGEVRIAAITRGSLDISFDGAARAIEVILDTVVPWRRENAKTIAKLNEQEKQATVLKIQAEAEAESEAAAAKAREEVRKLQLENEKLQVELHEKRIDLALKVIDKLNPELPQAQKIGYVIQLLEPIKVITESPLQLVDNSISSVGEISE